MKWLLSCVIVLSFLVSCADETMLNSTDVKQTTEKNIGETSRIGISGNACVELADVSSSLDGNTTTTRAVSVNSSDRRHRTQSTNLYRTCRQKRQDDD